MRQPKWPALDPSSDDRREILASARFTRNHSWKDRKYASLYSALLGPNGALALAEGRKAVRSVLENNGDFELLAVSRRGGDAIVVTDGDEAVLVSKSAMLLSAAEHPEGAVLRGLFSDQRWPRRMLAEWARGIAGTEAHSAMTEAPPPAGPSRPLPRVEAGVDVRIVTYNLRCGGSPGHLDALFEMTAPAVVLLQEALPPHRLLTADALEHWHVHWQGASSTWGSAILSRMPITRVIEFPGYAGWSVGAVIAGGNVLGSPQILVVSLHAPTRGSGTDYVAEVDRFLDQLRPVTEQMPLILGGDFNFRSLGQRLDSESIKTTADEVRVLRRLLDEFGLVNCWQESHPQTPLGQTLRWTSNRTNPYHCDGGMTPGW